MENKKKTVSKETKKEAKDNNIKNIKADKKSGSSIFAAKRKEFKGKKKTFGRNREAQEFEQRIVDLARVTRVMAGGKRMRFRACVVIGDRKGRVGFGLAKGADVTIAVTKAVSEAKKNIVEVTTVNGTIPHEIYKKKGAAKVLLKPAGQGKGVIAGGAVRVVLELAGIKNVTSKNLGTSNKMNITACTIEALKELKKVEPKNKKDKKKDVKKTVNNEKKDNKKTTK